MAETSLENLAAKVADGASIALVPDHGPVPAALIRALIRAGRRNLHVIGVPILGWAADLLVGASVATQLTAAAVTLGEFGPATRVLAALAAGTLTLTDATCPAIHSALTAAEKGIPFLPIRGLLGSDLLSHRLDWKTIQNPFAAEPDPLVLIPALSPDFALIHATVADEAGNVWLGSAQEMTAAAHAARQTLVTVERLVPGNLKEDPARAAGTLDAVYVSAIAVAEQGAWPLGLAGTYGPDPAHLILYAKLARSEAGFTEYLANHVLPPEPKRQAA